MIKVNRKTLNILIVLKFSNEHRNKLLSFSNIKNIQSIDLCFYLKWLSYVMNMMWHHQLTFFKIDMDCCFVSSHSATIHLFKRTIQTLQESVKNLENYYKISERRHWLRSGVYIVNVEQISQIVLVFHVLHCLFCSHLIIIYRWSHL